MVTLSKQLMSIDTEADVQVAPTTIKAFPENEVHDHIKRVCFPGMHYNDFTVAIGTLISCYGLTHEALLENVAFLDQFISPESETLKGKSVDCIINNFKKAYPDQVGTRLLEMIPPDCFTDEVYNNLPAEIRHIVLPISDRRKRDVCLVGIITALSPAFSRFRFYHGSGNDVKEYSPHLISLVLGAAGTGKGLTRYGAMLVAKIIQQATEMRKEAMSMYKKRKEEYDREKRKRDKDGRSTEDLTEPVRPPKYCFGMSASDTTQAALVEILNENPIGGFAFDSEVDTLVQGNANREFGGFSDIIRKVFHHEPLSRQRKGENESYIIESPRLAVMLSGTHDQLKKLIASEYNGLFSRIWYYSIPKSTFIPYTRGTQQRDMIGEMCSSLQESVLEKADLWSDELIYLSFSDEQEQQLFEAMQDKKYIEEKHGGDIGASWLRMALIVKRIAATLAAFQCPREPTIPQNCWAAAMALLPALKAHCLQALEIVRSNQGKLELSETDYKSMKGAGMTDDAIAKALGVSAKTLYRRRKEWTK